MAAPSHCRILIVDFGAQYTQLIARRLRELHVYCEIHPYDVGDDFIRAFAPRGIVLSGGPNSVTEGHTPRAPAAVWSQGVPVLGICYGMQTMAVQLGGCGADWTMHAYVPEAIARIRAQVGGDEVLLGLSGGVDSSVAAALIHQAIGDQLTCVFVDHGLLRQNEAEQVLDTFERNFGVRVIHVDAGAEFLAALEGVEDPEQKRRVIGRLFVEVFQREAAKLNNAKWLAQGTIYPDVIESAGAKTAKAHNIKSHHNVGGLPETLHLKLLEPLRELFKDEVRELGLELGLSREIVFRHPFPGPGLGVRILGEVKRERSEERRVGKECRAGW